MSSEKNETATKNDLETQQQKESASENEESDSITDQSSSVSENAKKKNKTNHHHTLSTHAKTSASTSTATQFSVQRSDVGGLRMKISAIRPNVNLNKSNSNNNNKKHTEVSKKVEKSKPHSISNNQKQSETQKEPLMGSSKNMATTKSNDGATPEQLTQTTTTQGNNDIKLTAATNLTAPYLSDATESGLSEATTTTIAAADKKSSKKVKVKRKKAPLKNIASGIINNKQHAHKKARLQNEFSSDSEDDLPLKLHQQRAPRLLLTAITAPELKLTATPAAGSDNIGLSSSDNELPNLVKAAIKRVESDTEDTTVEGSFRKAAKTKNLPQYQSTLLQDFMEKTQMLGQNASARLNLNISPDRSSLKAAASSQSESIASSTSRKRRGRPKKNSTFSTGKSSGTLAINESADSGVISTTSTTQSTTPSPKMQVAPSTTITTTSTTIATTSTRRQQQAQKNDVNNAADSPATSSAKPKIDIAYLDKRMYATERVLYPPPRNKRRQSTLGTDTLSREKKTTKEELDPVWRKIDVNKKFHLRSVSGYKSDGGTICSKILAAKSGYVSDYGSVLPRNHHTHNSGYKSDASCKSRYSTKSCMSRRSRAKSCGYRSDCKDGGNSMHKSSKFRRKRRASMLKTNTKTASNLNDEQDILQLAGLSLGQSSEESNEYVCKPSLKSLPTTSASKKYGEINRYVTTGQYFGRGTNEGNASSLTTFSTLNDTSQDAFVSKMLLQRKSTLTNDLVNTNARKIKSRRSSAASYCSSYYSGTSRVRRRHRRKSLCLSRSSSKVINIDSKLLTEIEIITTTFANRCRIQEDRLPVSSGKEKLLAEANKLQQTLSAAVSSTTTLNNGSNSSGNLAAPKARDKRTVKKRKINEPLVDFAMLSAAAGGALASSNTTSTGKRRHKKTSTSSSPDDHKLPLKKRHYLLTPGEKSSEVPAFPTTPKLNAEAWAAAAATAKSTASTKSQAQFNARTASTASTSGKSGLTPKKRHLLQTVSDDSASSSSPLRVVVDSNSISGGKLLDISPSSLCSLKQQKRNRLENALSKPNAGGIDGSTTGKLKSQAQVNSSPSTCPPPGVFEPSVELEIQIPPIAKLSEATAIITKAEVDSPLLTLDINASAVTKSEQGTRVVESLLHKTGGNLLLKRKRKKINRTGFPTVRRKKRKNTTDTQTTEATTDVAESDLPAAKESCGSIASDKPTTTTAGAAASPAATECERVPQAGEASDNFVARANQRTPRLSVVALERLQGSPRPTTPAAVSNKGKQPTRRSHKLAEDNKTESAESKRTKLIRTEGAVEEQPKIRGRKSKTVAAPEASSSEPTKATTNRRGKRTKTPSTALVTKVTPSNNKNNKTTTALTTKKLENNIKLPAGVDPNTNFSCKIRLKRRNTLHQLTIAKSSPLPTTENAKETPSTPEAIDAEAAAKDVDSLELEHDVLPLSEAQSLDTEYNSTCSDTSDEKSSNASNSIRKFMRPKKNYLAAGLFSDYFKQLEMPPPRVQKKANEKLATTTLADKQSSSDAATGPLLPPPPYCESYFRRTTLDFELPYDIWWAFKHAKLPGRNTVPSWNYRKIRTNVYAESVRPNMAGFDHPVCNCKPDAGCGDNCLNRMVYTECSPTNCPAGDKCRNQMIQRHDVAPGVERFMTENKGWGVRTKLPVIKGTYILEYVGEVVTEREFKDRMGTIYLNDTHHYCLHLDGGLVIDGQRMGSDCRFVNHSCEPNCEMQKWSVNGLSRMVLFAKRNIKEGEELTYDYNFSLFNPSEGQPCRCNTPQCRGVIGGKSQRVKPLPIENKPTEILPKDTLKGRQRKHKARKNAQQQTRDIAYARVQQLSEKEKKLVKQLNIFLVRNFEKIRRAKAKRSEQKCSNGIIHRSPTPQGSTTPTPPESVITKRRPSTPASTLAAQISALCTSRNIKTRGLTLAGQDPEVEKMAKMAVILRDICVALEELKAADDDTITLTTLVLTANAGGNKKKKAMKSAQKQTPLELKTVQSNIEQGHYKTPNEFDADMQKIFSESRQLNVEDKAKINGLDALIKEYNAKKQEYYTQLLEVIGDEQLLRGFEAEQQAEVAQQSTETSDTVESKSVEETSAPKPVTVPMDTVSELPLLPMNTTEDIIRCICGLYKDEGLMIQCSHCMVWQHTECTKADINADNYMCERCEPRVVDREIPLDDYTEEGHRYYLSLMRGELQVRQGDAVYVLRDIPIKDADGNVVPSQKHTYETIGAIDYQECDIFRVEHLWKNDEGKRFIFGHHFLRPHETFHEPSRRFYPNEVVRVSLYEVVPIELVIGRCWVLDRTTFCKGRPIECIDEDHCYICELRVDKTARFFSKAKANYPTVTKGYAFRKFPVKLKISKTYAPHDVNPIMLKSKRQKSDGSELSAGQLTPAATPTRQELNKTPQATTRKNTTAQNGFLPAQPTGQVLKQKRTRLENVLNTVKLKCLDAYTAQEPPIDLTYLLAGRGARQRKTNTN